MKKVVTILGKHNSKSSTRKVVENWLNKNAILDQKKHINMLNQLYLNETFDGMEDIQIELKKKLSGYKAQDVNKNLFNKSKFIKLDELKECLVLSKLNCYYCKLPMLLMYDKPRDDMQWTLDRINNDKGHNNDNVVIACLKCNLKRRTIDSDKFKFTKQMKIIKKL
jgi:5-methylcytosine-specific restriction endonuclease McrA